MPSVAGKGDTVKRIVQHAVIRVVQRQVAEYTCDRCGAVCGTRQNPKSTWHVAGTGQEAHYCLRTCQPQSGEETLAALEGE